MRGAHVHLLPFLSSHVVPRRLYQSKAADLHDVVGHRLHVVEIEPGASGHREALVAEILHRGPILAILILVKFGILPVADDHVLRKRVRKRRGLLVAVMDKALPARVAAFEEHVVPDHRLRPAGLHELRKTSDVPAHEFGVRCLDALGTCLRLGFVATEVEIRRGAEILVHLGDQFAQDALSLRIGKTPVPAARLVERLILWMEVESTVLLRAAARCRGVSVAVDLRNERDAEILAHCNKPLHLLLCEVGVRPAPPRVLFAPVHPPRFDDRVVELQKRRQTDRALDLLNARFREAAQMHGAEREMRTVRDRELRQKVSRRLESSAICDRELAQRIGRPTRPRERVRRDLHAGLIDGGGVRLIAGRRLQSGGSGLHFRRTPAEPIGEMCADPLHCAGVGAIDRHGRFGTERKIDASVARERLVRIRGIGGFRDDGGRCGNRRKRDQTQRQRCKTR